jgi:hypothetical protein
MNLMFQEGGPVAQRSRAESCAMVHRDAGKPTDRPHPSRATSRAIALDMREALSGKVFVGAAHAGIFAHLRLKRVSAGDASPTKCTVASLGTMAICSMKQMK